jgi:hypothetical protein
MEGSTQMAGIVQYTVGREQVGTALAVSEQEALCESSQV